jgi:DUF4097 and DUF4098 domain-containing protein YvlB
MSTHSEISNGTIIAIVAALGLIVPWSLVHAGKAISEHRAADPQGEVEIVDISGKVDVIGWDRGEVDVSGTADDNVERVDVVTTAGRTSIHVVLSKTHGWRTDGEVHLVVHVPAKSAVTASLVSADIHVAGLIGDLKLQSVSGNMSGDAGGNIRATTVSGDVRLAANAGKSIEVKTISGDIKLTDGGGEVELTTVSGNAVLDLADVSRGRFKSVSGDLSVQLALAADGQIEGESVSGDVSLMFASAPAADIEAQTFTGGIKNCFGPKPVESQYGPGSRLVFKNGEGHAHVHVITKSGDVQLCVKGANNAHVAAPPLPRFARALMRVPYVF